MKTYISTLYLNTINDLANNFALKRSLQFSKNYSKKVYNSTFEVYYNISLFLYIRLNKISKNKIDFNFNRINSFVLKRFSCKLYKKILNDLNYNNIIVINNHYLNNRKNGFSKSFLIHKNIINKINESKRNFKYKLSCIEIPEKIIKITGWTNTDNADDSFSFRRKLNTYYRNNQSKNNINIINYYNRLTYNENDLDNYCKDDEFLYNYYKKILNRLNSSPKFIKSRWYHPFHELSKDFRENVLLLDNEHIHEIFDVSGSDLHMLAKHLESMNIPTDELLKFQLDVKNDFRKMFGIRKYDGKCKEYVKKAFKVYLNSKIDTYSCFRKSSICFRIDKYFKENYPSIREYIINNDNIWQISMNEEFDVISNKMINYLNKNGIKALSCHDSIYVKNSVNIENIKDIFYQQLGLAIDRMNDLENL